MSAESVNGIQTYVCKLCLENFKGLALLKSHLSVKHPKESFSNMEMEFWTKNICEMDVPDDDSEIFLEEVIAIEIPEPINEEIVVQDDENSNIEECFYMCQYCQKSYQTFKSLQIHKIVHQYEELPYRCTKCPKQFMIQRWYREHENICRKNERVCQICNKNFNSRADAIIHEQTNFTTSKDLDCIYCQKSFEWQVLVNLCYANVIRFNELVL